MWYNYILSSPNTPKIYIGKTDNLKERFSSHKSDAKNNKPYYVYNSMRKHGIDTFIIEKIEEYETEQEALEGEIFWIAYYKSIDAELLNMTDGGEQSPMSGKKHTNATKLKMSKAKKGRRRTEKSKLQISLSSKGKKHSEETKLKISKANKGKIPSNKGKTVTSETKEKISLGQKGRKHNEESKLKISKAHKGKILTEEHKLKMSIAQKIRQQKIRENK